ncbi:MAG: hypothetical protein RLZZ490_1801, partial [Cyanobacteriota bacterium]
MNVLVAPETARIMGGSSLPRVTVGEAKMTDDKLVSK